MQTNNTQTNNWCLPRLKSITIDDGSMFLLDITFLSRSTNIQDIVLKGIVCVYTVYFIADISSLNIIDVIFDFTDNEHCLPSVRSFKYKLRRSSYIGMTATHRRHLSLLTWLPTHVPNCTKLHITVQDEQLRKVVNLLQLQSLKDIALNVVISQITDMKIVQDFFNTTLYQLAHISKLHIDIFGEPFSNTPNCTHLHNFFIVGDNLCKCITYCCQQMPTLRYLRINISTFVLAGPNKLTMKCIRKHILHIGKHINKVNISLKGVVLQVEEDTIDISNTKTMRDSMENILF